MPSEERDAEPFNERNAMDESNVSRHLRDAIRKEHGRTHRVDAFARRLAAMRRWVDRYIATFTAARKEHS